MYFVPDGTSKYGFYECRECNYRFLSLHTLPKIECPLCEQDIDCEIGPDESMEDLLDTSDLKEILVGEDTIKQLDQLLSCAFQDDDDSWI